MAQYKILLFIILVGLAERKKGGEKQWFLGRGKREIMYVIVVLITVIITLYNKRRQWIKRGIYTQNPTLKGRVCAERGRSEPTLLLQFYINSIPQKR